MVNPPRSSRRPPPQALNEHLYIWMPWNRQNDAQQMTLLCSMKRILAWSCSIGGRAPPVLSAWKAPQESVIFLFGSNSSLLNLKWVGDRDKYHRHSRTGSNFNKIYKPHKYSEVPSRVSTQSYFILFHLVSATQFQVTWYRYTKQMLVACAELWTYRPLVSRVSRGSPPHSQGTALAQQKPQQVNHGEPTSIIATSASASIEWTSIYLNAMKQAKWCTANDLVMFNETYPSLILLDRRAGPSCPQCMKSSTGKCHLPLRQQLIIVESEMGGGSGQISPSFQDRFKL